MSNSCHCKIHTDLRALSLEVRSQILEDILTDALCNTYYVLSSPFSLACLLFELLSANAAYRTFFRSRISLMNITTYCTNKFFFFFKSPFLRKCFLPLAAYRSLYTAGM